MKNEIQVTEKKLKLTARDFRELFRKPEYTPAGTIAFLDKKKPNEEKIVEDFLNVCTPLVIIFNQLMDKHETIITESSFVDYVLNIFHNKATENKFEMTPERREYLRWRAESAYRGFITEFYAITLLLESVPNILISTNEKADLKEGVDFMVSKLGTVITQRLHVTSIEGEKRKNQKEKVVGRCFEKDRFLLYNNQDDDDKSYLINSFPFFKKRYLLNTLEELINDKSKGFKNDDPDFIDRCTKHRGKWEVFRSNDIDHSYEEEIQEIKRILGNKI